MNRRSLLALIGFAPLATAAAALPRVADPVKLASTGGREVSANVPFVYEGDILYLENAYTGVITAGNITDAIPVSAKNLYIHTIVDDVSKSMTRHLEWVNAETQGIIKRIDTLK